MHRSEPLWPNGRYGNRLVDHDHHRRPNNDNNCRPDDHDNQHNDLHHDFDNDFDDDGSADNHNDYDYRRADDNHDDNASAGV